MQETSIKYSAKKIRSFLTTAILAVAFILLVISYLVNTTKISIPITLALSLVITGLTLILFFLNANKTSLKTGFLFIIFIALHVVAYLFHATGLEYLFNLISLIGVLLAVPYFEKDSKIFKVLPYLLISFSVLLVIFAPTGAVLDEKSLISFKNANPNSVSFILMITSIFILQKLAGVKSAINKSLLFILLVAVYAMQLRFQGRIALLGSLLCLGYFLIRKYVDRLSKKTVFTIVFTILILSPVFCYFYSVTLFELIGKGNLIIMGKDLFTGRQVIWSEAFGALEGNWLIGLGNTFKSSWIVNGVDEASTNLHNQMMGCLVCFGFVNMLSFALIYSLSIARIWAKTDFKFVGVLLVILAFVSYTDTVFYSSLNVPIIIIGAGMLCVNKKEKDNDKENSLCVDRE